MGNYYEVFDPPFFMERRYRYDAIAVNPAGYARQDSEIINDLLARLKQIAPIDTSSVTMSCVHQVVNLGGTTNSPAVAKFIGRVAENVLGVRDVENHIEIKRAGASAVVNADDKQSAPTISEPGPAPLDRDLSSPQPPV